MNIKSVCAAACIGIALWMPFTVQADSPLTSTYFATSYYSYEIVGAAEKSGALTDEIAAYLLDNKNPVDVKAAVVNALGWSYDGRANAEVFKAYLAKKYNASATSLNLNSLRDDELMCLGYMMAMDNYFVVDDAIEVLDKAIARDTKSFTIHMIHALVSAQKAMDTDWCMVWKLTAQVLQNDTLFRDLKTAATQTIVDYMILYKSDCGDM
ncbi:MAG: hypothetical protein R2794_04545 [Chitinophagales bacterium]